MALAAGFADQAHLSRMFKSAYGVAPGPLPSAGDSGVRDTGVMGKARDEILVVAGREVTITNPDKVFFPQAGHTKLDLARYYAAVAEGALRGIAGRPIVLKRYVDGAEGEPFFQKRAPEQHPEWVETVELRFPSGRTAREIVVRDAAQLLWIVNLGLHRPEPASGARRRPRASRRAARRSRPRARASSWDDVRRVALLVRDVLDEHGLRGWPKTSGSRGMHVNVRIERRWSFDQVRRAALALAREVERRAPEQATSKWWKEERHGVFLDYNQNAKDRTVASAWSVRPTPDARVSMPLDWDEVADCDPAAFTLATAPARFAERGDAAAGIDDAGGIARRPARAVGRAGGRGPGRRAVAAALPKQGGEPPRVAPSRRKGAASRTRGGAGRDAPARHDRQGGAQGGRARRPRALEGAPPGGRGAARSRRRPRRLDARPLDDVDPHPRQPAPRARGRAPGRGAARSRLRPLARLGIAGAEDALQLVGGRDLELIVAAVGRRLSGRQRRNCAAWRKRVPCMWS